MTREFDVGLELFARKEYPRAAKVFEEVLLGDPHHHRAWSYLGISLAHMGRAPEAEQALRRALEIAPTNGECWFHLGVAQSLEADWPRAAETLRHAAALLPDDLSAWHRLGVALAEAGDQEGSAAAFERALILSRDVGGAERTVRGSRGHGDDHLSEPGEREGPKEAESWLSLALSLLTLGDVEEAVAAYERGYEVDPERARHSMFRPMLQLLTSTAGGPEEELPGGRAFESSPDTPIRPPQRPTPVGPDDPLTGVG
ncbi:MAG: tetratricopeptide repeat protein [Thermoplasmata archaeon]|nr:tetratricopeptide repeat protein [Thermoplasmata archaeon]